MLLSKYAADFDASNPLKEYPRPQFIRESYLSLNGPWSFTITKSDKIPTLFKQTIIVPYCVESYLSKQNISVLKGDYLYYYKKIELDPSFIKDKVILHIDAVDQIANLFINGVLAGHHENGYLPFICDITSYLKDGKNDIVIQVIDHLSNDYPYGKQKVKRGGMWYTPVSGIWQSVWVESVSNDYIKNIKITPDIDAKEVSIEVDSDSDYLKVSVFDGLQCIYQAEKENDKDFKIKIDDMKLWSPDHPFLYDVIVESKNDKIKSYFAMRKIAVNDKYFLLNNEPFFIHGLLDQGYFPDGIYTPASYQAYHDDIESMKKLGFNALRKHIKVEPLRYYYECDKQGMIVLQDIVNISKYSFLVDTVFPTIGLKKRFWKPDNVSSIQKKNFKKFMLDEIAYLYNCPCVSYYTIFNEGWGQHDEDSYYELLKKVDSSRVVDSTSGWFFGKKSDVTSLHIYFKKIQLNPSDRPIIVSEFGGYALKEKGHVFDENSYYGYKKYEDLKEYQNGVYELYQNDIIANIKNGLAGCIYTQVSDVEDEINGILTYDRCICKLEEDKMQNIAKQIKKEFEEHD